MAKRAQREHQDRFSGAEPEPFFRHTPERYPNLLKSWTEGMDAVSCGAESTNYWMESFAAHDRSVPLTMVIRILWQHSVQGLGSEPLRWCLSRRVVQNPTKLNADFIKSVHHFWMSLLRHAQNRSSCQRCGHILHPNLEERYCRSRVLK